MGRNRHATPNLDAVLIRAALTGSTVRAYCCPVCGYAYLDLAKHITDRHARGETNGRSSN